MIEFLRNLTPVWQFSAVILAFIGVVLTILNRTQRQYKALSYEMVYRVPVATVSKLFVGRVKILLDDKPVQNAHLVVVRILNSGNVPIVPTDYDHPVYLHFGENAQVLIANITEREPEDLLADITTENHKVVLNTVTLNREDSIEILMLVNQFEKLKVGGHIVGVKEIRELSEEIKARARPLDIFARSLAGLALCVLLAGYLAGFLGSWSTMAISLFIRFIFLACAIVGIALIIDLYMIVRYYPAGVIALYERIRSSFAEIVQRKGMKT